MEVDGHTHLTMAMINFMVAAAVSKTVTLTGPVESFKSMATSSEHNSTKGLEASFLKALDDHQGIIIKICRAYTNTRADEEDLFQEIVYQLWKAWPSFQGNAQISTWMHTVALRTAIAPFRRGRQVETELREVLPDRAADDEPIHGEVGDRLFNLFHRLGNFDRAILTLMMEGFSQKEIGSILNLREGTVAKRVSRVRKMIDQY